MQCLHFRSKESKWQQQLDQHGTQPRAGLERGRETCQRCLTSILPGTSLATPSSRAGCLFALFFVCDCYKKSFNSNFVSGKMGRAPGRNTGQRTSVGISRREKGSPWKSELRSEPAGFFTYFKLPSFTGTVCKKGHKQYDLHHLLFSLIDYANTFFLSIIGK